MFDTQSSRNIRTVPRAAKYSFEIEMPLLIRLIISQKRWYGTTVLSQGILIDRLSIMLSG